MAAQIQSPLLANVGLSDDFSYFDFRIFLAVGETGSFRKAGERLSIGQSAVSRRIQKVEDALGVSLFERRPSGARLTTAGTFFASRVRGIVNDWEAAAEGTRSAGIAVMGQLRLGIIASLSRGPLRNVLKTFLEAHNGVEICVVEADRSELLTDLSHRRMDAVIAAGDPMPENGDAMLLAREEVFLAVPSHLPCSSRDRLSWDDVQDATFVVSAREPGPEIHNYILSRISGLGQTARIRRHSVSREGIMTLVGLGLGMTLVADQWRGASYPNVSFVRIGNEGETVPFSITWRPENDNPALRRFLSLARIEAKRNGALSAPPQSPDPSP